MHVKKGDVLIVEKKLTQKNSTLDHRYPRDTGGISITDNLYPCCPKHNSEKGNLTHEEYLKVQRLPKKRKEEISKYNSKISGENIQKNRVCITKKMGYL